MEEKIIQPRVLHLSLRYQWYDMIERGEKTEEYREIKDYWLHRLVFNSKVYSVQYMKPSNIILYQEHYDYVCFHRGQGGKQTMFWEYKGLNIGYGKPEWGAPTDKRVFIIKLGKRVDKPVIKIPQATKEGAIECELEGVIDISYPNSKTRRGRVQDRGTVTPTLTRNTESSLRHIGTDYRIRKLTPRECFRLMGVQEPDIDKLLSSGISNSQLYKLAGNSICVPTLVAILRQLMIGNFNKVTQTEII